MDIHGALGLLERKWLELAPDSPFEYSFLGEEMARLYESEVRNRKIFGYASWFAVFIASLGAFGLMAMAAARRTKEVGIRKVLGASISSLVFLITGSFLKLVLVANLIAWPIAYFSVRNWLQNFAYRIDIPVGVFALGGSLVFFIAVVTVSAHALRTAMTNPVNALRYE